MASSVDNIVKVSTDALFAPFKLKNLELPNRIVMAPMTRCASPGGVPGPDMRAWYRRRAENGVGLVITEGVRIPHAGSNHDPNVPCFYGEEALAEWDLIRQDVQATGCKIMPQLWHVGLMLKPELANIYREVKGLGEDQCGPSGMVGGLYIMPEKLAKPMTQADIDAVIDAYGVSAEIAYKMGFDGIALHGAHGYLIDQFLWDKTNLREDRYAGSIEARATFAAEIVAEIRRRTSPDFPISLRFSQWKGHDFSAKLANNPQELERMLRPIIDAGVDMFDCSTRRFWEPEFEGSDLNLAGWTKKVSGVATMTVGSISLDTEMIDTLLGQSSQPTGIDRLIEMLERGDFDLVGVARALIANPDWPMLIRDGSYNKLKPYNPELLEKVY